MNTEPRSLSLLSCKAPVFDSASNRLIKAPSRCYTASDVIEGARLRHQAPGLPAEWHGAAVPPLTRKSSTRSPKKVPQLVLYRASRLTQTVRTIEARIEAKTIARQPIGPPRGRISNLPILTPIDFEVMDGSYGPGRGRSLDHAA